MNKRTLTKALRRRLARKYHPGDVAARSDEQILAAYLVCSQCQTALFSNPAAAISNSKDADEFLSLVNMALAAHMCASKN